MKPIKRHAALQPLSREHHDGLLFCWKIREGIKLKKEPERMKSYADWFYINHLLPHFKKEEEIYFPLLGNEHEQIKQAIRDHADITSIINISPANYKTLSALVDLLEKHIRFEERVLFFTIEENAINKYKNLSDENNQGIMCDVWEDEFWKK